MSPKTRAIVRMYVSVLVLAAPAIATEWANAGFSHVALYITLGLGTLGIIFHAYQVNIPDLPDSDGNTGGAATKLGGKSPDSTQKTNPPSPFRTLREPTHHRYWRVSPVIAAALIGYAALSGHSTDTKSVRAAGCSGTTVVADLTPAGACIVGALESGQIDFTNPTQAVIQIAKLCVGSTAESILAVIVNLLAVPPTDGGISAPYRANLVALRDAAAQLHGTYTEMTAK